jgi:hypothetical protein
MTLRLIKIPEIIKENFLNNISTVFKGVIQYVYAYIGLCSKFYFCAANSISVHTSDLRWSPIFLGKRRLTAQVFRLDH